MSNIVATTLGGILQNRAQVDPRAAAIVRYVKSCRSAEKGSYAIAFGAFLLGLAPEPDRRQWLLSYMGAQAVEMSLTDAVG